MSTDNGEGGAGRSAEPPAERQGIVDPDRSPGGRAVSLPRSGWAVASGERTAGAAHVTTLVVAFIVLLWLDRNRWFFGDEWDFIDRLVGGHGLRLLDPHNQHWSTLPLLAYKALFSVFGLHSYLPYVGLLVAAHLLAAHLLWRVMRRTGAGAWVSTGLATVFLLLGCGFENLFWAFQIGWVFPLCLGYGALLIAAGRPRFDLRSRVAVWLLLAAALMCSMIGVGLVAAAGLHELLRRGWRSALVIAGPLAALFVAWLLIFGWRNVASGGVGRTSILLMPDFVWKGLSGAIDGATGLAGVGAAAVGLLVVWVIVRGETLRTTAPLPLALAGATVILLGLMALGRIQDVNGQLASRYLYCVIALLLPLVAVAARPIAVRGGLALAGLLVVCLVMTWHGVGLLYSETQGPLARGQEHSRGVIEAAAWLVAERSPVIGGYPEPGSSPDLTTADLAALLRSGALRVPVTPPPAVDLVEAEANLQTAVGGTPHLGTGSSLPALRAGAGTDLSVQGECATVSSRGGQEDSVSFTSGGPTRLLLTPAGSGTATLRVLAPDGTSSQPRTFSLDPGTPLYLEVSAGGIGVTVDLGGTAGQLCGTA